MKTTRNLTEGPIFKTFFLYSLPLIIANVVQILFQASNVAVLSIVADDRSVAAVGACGALITLLIGLCSGFATGAGILIAKKVGANDETGVRSAVGTSLLFGVSTGIVLMAIAIVFARPMLTFLNCQPDVLDSAVLYLRMYFLGVPVLMLYNFTYAILRAAGDSVHPLMYMLVSGITHVLANVIFVGVLKLTVEGVAFATILSNLVLLTLSLSALIRSRGICRIERKYLRIRGYEIGEIVRIGIPTSIASILFYISDVVLSATVNSISTEAMAANALASQLDSIVYTVGYSIALAMVAVVGQNFGAGKLDRVRKTVRQSVLYAITASLSVGILLVVFAEPLLGLLNDNPAVVDIAKGRMTLMCLTYFTTSVMEIFHFSMPVFHRQVSAMVVGFFCGFCMRSFWAWFIWPQNKTLPMLFTCFAISATVATAIYFIIYLRAMKKEEQKIISHNRKTEEKA